MKLSRKWILVAALVMSVAMATSGTLAYLTDRESATNVFTFGNVDIELNEEFEQGTALVPGVVIEKAPTITNTGKNAAWVWATIAIPSDLDVISDASKNVVHFNFTKESVTEGYWNWTFENDNYVVEEGKEINGEKYNVYTVLYDTVLQPGDTTAYPVMTQVYLDYHIDIDPKGNLYHVEKGEITPIQWNINTDGAPIIYLAAYAIQEEGFQDAKAAYAAYGEQWDDKGEPEFSLIPTAKVDTVEELEKALADASDNTAISIAAGDYGIVEIAGELNGVEIKGEEGVNVRFNILSTAKLTDVTFNGLNSEYTESSAAYVDGGMINIDAGAQVKNLVIENCDVTASGGRSSLVGIAEPSAEVTIRNSKVSGPKYLVYSYNPIAVLNVEGCEIENISSWLVMMNASDSVGAKLTIQKNNIDNCTGGVAKYLGSSQPEGAATKILDNTLTNCTGHDGSDAKWFTIPGATSTITVSGNTLDGNSWAPSTAQGLGK